MKFLVKCAFWLGLVVLMLPMPDEQKGAPGMNVSASDAIAFLGSAMNDVKGFCARNPESCVTGSSVVQTFGHKAQNGAKMLHDFINEKMQDTASLPVPKPAGAGATRAATFSLAAPQPKRGTADTLKADDRAAGWRGEQSAKEEPQG